jgi:hypothetical protein
LTCSPNSPQPETPQVTCFPSSAGIDAGGAGDHPGENMVGSAGRAADPGDAARIGFELRHQLLHGADRRVRRHGHDFEFAGEARNPDRFGELGRRFVRGQRAEHHHAGNDHGIALPATLREETREADRAAAARHVLHADLANDAFVPKRQLHGARGLVPAAAGPRRHEKIKARHAFRRSGDRAQCARHERADQDVSTRVQGFAFRSGWGA